MAIILTDPCVSCAHRHFGAFEKLKVYVMSANQRASYAIPPIASSRIQQNSGQCRLVEAKRLRHIDYLDEVCDDLCPCGIERNMSML